MTESAEDQYRTRRGRYSGDITRLERASNRYSNLRLVVFLAAIVIPLVSYNTGNLAIAAVVVLVGAILFFLLVVRHGVIIDRLEIATRLLEINQQGLSRINGDWTANKHQGDQFLDRAHPYTVDLDIFGRRSLFQWICAAHSRRGQARLAEILSQPVPLNELPFRQQAVLELAGKLDFRQQLEQLAMTVADKEWNPLLTWAESPGSPWHKRGLVNVLLYFPAVTLAIGGIAYLAGGGIIPLLVLLTIQGMAASSMARSLSPRITLIERQQEPLGTLEASLTLLENEEFTTELNQKLKSTIQTENYSAARQINLLRATAGWLQIRNNPPIYFVLSVLFLWDLQWVTRAERWRSRNGKRIRQWISTLAEFEALGSLSIIHFENPDWPFPGVSEHRPVPFESTELGHPLLARKVRVTNSIQIERTGNICLITGSNMSGKSTFLRSVGINLVLAYAGAPVCAGAMSCAYMPLYTSMRVTDDLGEGVSSFYAELLRVKTIIDACRHQPVCCLIDEIFRGTNSRDRLNGAKEVLKALTQMNAIGLVSTHDLELSRLADEFPERFKNYHFSEHYTEHGIVFEYRLQEGESQTTNAVYLMKRLGIMPA